MTISEYVEGTDAECAEYCLEYPFPPEWIDSALEHADMDANELWDLAHG